MLALFKEIINDMRAISESITAEGVELKEAVVQYVLTLVTMAVLIGVLMLFIYLGIDIVGGAATVLGAM